MKYRLVYFNVKGRAEVARMLFAQAGEKYEDTRLTSEEWAAMKKDTPMGGLPILEVEGEKLCQSKAIDRFLARRFGLAGKTDLQQAKVDMIIECFEDAMKPVQGLFVEKDEEKKAALKKKFEEEHLPVNLSKIEKLLCANKGGDGYFVGDEITVADITAAQILSFGSAINVDFKMSNFPKLKALKARVESQPKIAQWIANRPETAM